jgi:predicted ester cyclase
MIMSIEENKNLVRQIVKQMNDLKGDVSKLPSLFQKYYLPGYIHHDPSRGDMTGEQRMQYIAMMLAAFPDLSYSEDGMVAERDMVSTRYTMRVTHTGTFMGIPATGKQIVAKGADVRRLEGGKVAEIWDFPDTLAIMTQLGAVISLPTPK